MNGFLLDEHVPIALAVQLQRRDSSIHVYRVGDGVAPPISASDPDLMRWIETMGCILVMNNRSTMPVHMGSHLSGGGHVPGIVQLPRQVSIPSIVDDLILLWSAALPEDLRDRIVYLPL